MNENEFNEKFMQICSELNEAQNKLNKLQIENYKNFDMLDEDGYPTHAALKIIELWPYDDKKGWFDFINHLWWQPNFGWNEGPEQHEWKDEKVYRYHISTGGWSGNETIIEAMEMNKNFLWTMTWVQSRRGGHYIFEREIND
jgi:hypothetical protein